MADNPIKWSALGTAVVALTGTSSSTGLMSLSTGHMVTGEAYDNSAGYQYGYIMARARGSAAFAAGDYLSGWFLKSLGANYEDGENATSSGPVRAADFIVPLRAVAVQQETALGPVTLPATTFKVLVYNLSTKALTTSTGENEIIIYPFNDNLVTP